MFLSAKEPVWGEWASFEECSKTCGGGLQIRHRECLKDRAKVNVEHCTGLPDDEHPCNNHICPVGMNSVYFTFANTNNV